MKNVPILAALAALMCAGCVQRVDNSKETREGYERSLQDSIEIVKQEIDSCNSQISRLRDQNGVWLRDFSTVANPREVGSYIIYTPFKNKYPLRATGLMARINDSGQYELIATHSGAAFNQIEVSVPSVSISSEIVAQDQALNYRNEGLSTVTFTGEKADSIGKLIADNELNNIKVTYLQGRPVGSWNVPQDYAKMLSYTYLLYSGTSEMQKLERKVPMLHEKINLLRAHMENK